MKQYVVYDDWSLELTDIEGVHYWPMGAKGFYGNKACRTIMDCLVNKRHNRGMSPEAYCRGKKCVGEGAPSMVYVMGQLFLHPLSARAPELQAIANECTDRNSGLRPTAVAVVERIRMLYAQETAT
eukprot:NODE_10164_length_494_cov_3.079019_g10141_i0.p2 GENE.NODE_10164_length_494_cov_3.079019_g10141_i0~~NODE_10164_length_494_cov_3.079019_g10141_i0.p2  ORF type:complete len:126 (-),score=23.10 NODE_10164_length_494_cov_3.079019_g10141_i0:116-493(-)